MSYLKQIFENAIAQLTWTGIVALLTGIITFFASRNFKFTTLEICLSVLMSVMLIIIISYIIYRRTNKKLPIYNSVDCDFCIIREERKHKWINETDYIHKRRYTLKALRNGLTEYVDKFMWTGSNYLLTGGEGDYSIEIDKCSKNIYTVYHFKFNTPLKRGEIIDIEATWESKGPAKPFFSTTIEEPTNTLVMSVMLFPKSGIKEINCEVESYKGAKFPNEKKKERLNSDGEYTWEIKNPKLLHHYEINWKLDNNH